MLRVLHSEKTQNATCPPPDQRSRWRMRAARLEIGFVAIIYSTDLFKILNRRLCVLHLNLQFACGKLHLTHISTHHTMPCWSSLLSLLVLLLLVILVSTRLSPILPKATIRPPGLCWRQTSTSSLHHGRVIICTVLAQEIS
jgi:hypothetical protein